MTLQGLTESEAQERLLRDGPNELQGDVQRGFLSAAWNVLRQPMFLLLLGAGTLYVFLGDLFDAVALLFAVVAMIATTLYQDRKSERAVHKLKELTTPLSRVLRDGVERAVPTRELVRGDVVLLREGDRVPADGVVIECTNLRVDESLLTGESVPVDKLPASEERLLPPGSDDSGSAYAGTLVVQGTGHARVLATAGYTAMGRIGAALRQTEQKRSLLGQEVDRVVRRIALGGALLCAAVILAYGLLEGDFVQGWLAGITLAMAILPEEAPVVLTVFTLLGAFRIAKHGVIARRPEAIESLGSATVLCIDKTGTITENRMRVAMLCPRDGDALAVGRTLPQSVPEAVHELLEFGVLACAPNPHDPMDQALRTLGETALRDTEHLHREYVREQEYPLTRSLLAVSHLWSTDAARGHVAAAKGAPEAIADLCHLDAEAMRALMAQAESLAASGLRVLGVAHARYEQERHPDDAHTFEFVLSGLIGFEDPVRESVPAAMAAFRHAGVRVVMITGDHAATARAISEQAGMALQHGVMLGKDFAALDEPARIAAVQTHSVFARAAPEHKLMLVRALESAGELVAMTGDGVNDAPALKASHIGIAMGARGTDVAREASALVLTNEDFGAIAHSIVLGRRIFDNLRKAMRYILSVHVPIAAMALLPVLLGMPPMFFPIHVVFLEMVIDPACTIALEAEEPDPRVLTQPPRRAGGLFSRRAVVVSVLQGMSLLVAVLAVFVLALRHTSEEQARALSFVTLVVGNLALILVQRSGDRSALSTLLRTRNVPANVLSLAALVALALSLLVPLLRELFHFALPEPTHLALAAGAALVSVLWMDLLKQKPLLTDASAR
jgi:P-type Ca2+ transporter type 2C